MLEQPKVTYRYMFRYFTMINFTKETKKACLQLYCPKDSKQLQYIFEAEVLKEFHPR